MLQKIYENYAHMQASYQAFLTFAEHQGMRLVFIQINLKDKL